MDKRVWAGVGMALLLQGCGKPHGIYANTADEAVRPVAVAPAGPSNISYVGRWASAAPACAAHAWVFAPDRLTTPAGATCDIIGPQPTPGGFSANSACKAADGKFKAGRLVMTLTHAVPGHADTANSMTISEGPFGDPVNLVRCAA